MMMFASAFSRGRGRDIRGIAAKSGNAAGDLTIPHRDIALLSDRLRVIEHNQRDFLRLNEGDEHWSRWPPETWRIVGALGVVRPSLVASLAIGSAQVLG